MCENLICRQDQENTVKNDEGNVETVVVIRNSRVTTWKELIHENWGSVFYYDACEHYHRYYLTRKETDKKAPHDFTVPVECGNSYEKGELGSSQSQYRYPKGKVRYEVTEREQEGEHRGCDTIHYDERRHQITIYEEEEFW
jgi:hypothetical protein